MIIVSLKEMENIADDVFDILHLIQLVFFLIFRGWERKAVFLPFHFKSHAYSVIVLAQFTDSLNSAVAAED